MLPSQLKFAVAVVVAHGYMVDDDFEVRWWSCWLPGSFPRRSNDNVSDVSFYIDILYARIYRVRSISYCFCVAVSSVCRHVLIGKFGGTGRRRRKGSKMGW